ncbi:hypothetical protein [Hymenobacter fodinae]|uniref:Uncharacterized protein n=1 Tax=Hymenobacter fodinae TaxID=2510796 RepID=A0A4Z0P5Q1_9BACT|nr:hypothetical protein [Hymenobacter fodinae]TGE07722.1 hypothetical protein EU556_08180 [Hymenobacter fodinae]
MLPLHTLPTNWGDVTLGQAAKLEALGEASIQDCLALLLDCSIPDLLQLRGPELGAALHQVLFLAGEEKPDFTAFVRPTVIRLGGSIASVEVPVLDTLEDLSFGQAADIGALMQELGSDIPQLRLQVLATILQPAYDGTAYDSDRVAVLEVLCADIKLRDALPLTDFFLPSTTASAGATPPSSSASPSAVPSRLPTSAALAKSGIP